MPITARKAGVLREAGSVYYRDNGVLRTAEKVWRRENGVLREVFTSTITQSIFLRAAWFDTRVTHGTLFWQVDTGRPQIDTLLTGGESRYLWRLILSLNNLRPLRSPGEIELNLVNTSGGEDNNNADFSTDFENNGSITVTANGRSFTAAMGDTSDPYVWVPTNAQDVIDFINGSVNETPGTVSGTLTLTLPVS